MAKSNRDKIKLVSSAGTGHYYTTDKNKRTKPEAGADEVRPGTPSMWRTRKPRSNKLLMI